MLTNPLYKCNNVFSPEATADRSRKGRVTSMSEYAHPEVLVSTDWVADHLDDSRVKLVEVDVDTEAYEQGHVKGAVGWNWTTQLNDVVRRDILGQADFERLM